MQYSVPFPPSGTSLLSLQQRRAALSSMPSSAAIIRSRREARIYRFRPNSVQRDDFPHPRPFSLSTLPLARPANRSRNDDRTNCYAPRLALRMCAGGFMRAATGRVCVCCMHVCARECVYMCISLCVARAIELCSNCAKLRISVSDELRDLQYNCATSSLLLPLRSYPLSTRLCRRGRKNYSLVRDICTAYVRYGGIYVLACERAQQTR